MYTRYMKILSRVMEHGPNYMGQEPMKASLTRILKPRMSIHSPSIMELGCTVQVKNKEKRSWQGYASL